MKPPVYFCQGAPPSLRSGYPLAIVPNYAYKNQPNHGEFHDPAGSLISIPEVLLFLVLRFLRLLRRSISAPLYRCQ